MTCAKHQQRLHPDQFRFDALLRFHLHRCHHCSGCCLPDKAHCCSSDPDGSNPPSCCLAALSSSLHRCHSCPGCCLSDQTHRCSSDPGVGVAWLHQSGNTQRSLQPLMRPGPTRRLLQLRAKPSHTSPISRPCICRCCWRSSCCSSWWVGSALPQYSRISRAGWSRHCPSWQWISVRVSQR